jgi:hypothetical protein
MASFVALLLIFFLSGCLLQRLFKIKDQLCDFEYNFLIEVNEGVRLSFREPVLLDTDVTWLVGADPSEWQVMGNQLFMRYIVEKQSVFPSSRYDLPIELRFLQINGSYRLKEVYLSRNLTNMLTTDLLTQSLQSACRAEKSIVGRSVTVDLTNLDRSLLLTRSKVIDILGEPNRVTVGPYGISYDYKLRTNGKTENRSRIDAYFNESGNEMLRVKISYLRYHLDADFVTGKAILKLKASIKSNI